MGRGNDIKMKITQPLLYYKDTSNFLHLSIFHPLYQTHIVKIIYLLYPHNIFYPSNQAAPLSHFPSRMTKANKRGQMHKLCYCMASPIPPHQCNPQHNHIEHTLTSKYSHTHSQIYLTQSPNQSITLFNHKWKTIFKSPHTIDQNPNPNPNPNPETHSKSLHPLHHFPLKAQTIKLQARTHTNTSLLWHNTHCHRGLQLLP